VPSGWLSTARHNLRGRAPAFASEHHACSVPIHSNAQHIQIIMVIINYAEQRWPAGMNWQRAGTAMIKMGFS
jgi:hypothetical protein